MTAKQWCKVGHSSLSSDSERPFREWLLRFEELDTFCQAPRCLHTWRLCNAACACAESAAQDFEEELMIADSEV